MAKSLRIFLKFYEDGPKLCTHFHGVSIDGFVLPGHQDLLYSKWNVSTKLMPTGQSKIAMFDYNGINSYDNSGSLYYIYYSYRALCVILLSNVRGRLPAPILSSHESESLWDVATVTKVRRA